jgi:hypothetical protein
LHGIRINSLILPYADIKKLYIKLDKKLIVKADYLKIKKSYKKTDTKSQLLSIKDYLKYFHQFFKELDIKKLEYNNQNIRLKYIYNKFFLDTNELYFLASISISNKSSVHANIQNLYLKNYFTYLKGRLNINLNENKIDFDGSFKTHKIKGFAKLTLKDDILDYYIYDATANEITTFMDYLNSKITINKEISNWIYRYITAKMYNLHYITGKLDIRTGDFFPKLMRASATAKNVNIKFHKNLKSAETKKIDITLKNDTLRFKLFKPSYQGIDLNGSKVTITHLLSKGAAIEVILKAKYPLDKKVKEILQAYGVDIPLSQKNSFTNSLIRIYIPFVPYSFHIKGYFYTKNSDIYFKNIKFHTKQAEIYLKDNIVKLNNTFISYKKLFDINTTGVFHTDKNLYTGDIKINRLFLKYKDEVLLDTDNTKSRIRIDFSKSNILLKDLNTSLLFDKSKEFTFHNLGRIYKISPFLQKYDIKHGKADLYTNNFKLFQLKSDLYYDNNKILLYNDKLLKNFNLNGSIDTKNIKLNINNNMISADISDKVTINTNNISYDFRNSLSENKSKKSYFKKPITLNAMDATIYINKELTLPTTTFTLFLNKDKKIFSSVYGKNHIFYSKDSKIVDIHTNFLSAEYINTIIHHDLFKNGSFMLSIKEANDLFWGNCKISDSMIKSPKKGGSDFKIDTGEFNFYLKNSILTLKDIVLRNNFSTLKGDGYVDLKNKKLNLVFKVDILKDLGKTIKAIPLIGYILLGKDGKFSSKVTVTGNFDNPQVQTDFSKDVIKSPLNIIFRVIKLPFKLLLPKRDESNLSK